MSHESSISGMGEPVQAIRVINEKRLLLILVSDQHRLINQKPFFLIMVGINIILSFGKEYVKFAWECTGKPGQEIWDFLHLKKFEMTGKTNYFVHIEVLCILERHW
jgi:hypothetical protein